MEGELENKYNKLKEIIGSLGRVAVAFSGGVDSTLLLKVSIDVLGSENVIAVVASSPTYPEAERSEAFELAHSMGARLIQVLATEMSNVQFVANNPDRCYHCKTELFSAMRGIVEQEGFDHVLEGSNVDDLKDYRPGRRACGEAGVKSPLTEAGLTKDDIRSISKELGLATYGKPAQACLATRIPYGTVITQERLKTIEIAEAFVRSLGVSQVRVRHHRSTARIEVDETGLPVVLEYRNEIVDKLIELGFMYVSLDLKGYRTGSMNNGISTDEDGLT